MIKDKVDYPSHVREWKETGGTMAAYYKEKGLNYQTSWKASGYQALKSACDITIWMC